jgi:DHA2 family multidrug resistance protein-like MFS transporter
VWTPTEEGHPRRWAILSVLLVSLLIVVLDNTVLNIALPTIQEDLQATQSELIWAVDSYILVFAALLFTWGALGDSYGRRRILIIGMVIFGLASAICAFSVNAQMLIGFRAVMGIGGAAVLPTTLAIITAVFPRHERGKAIGTWAGAVGAAVALGPVLSGVLLHYPAMSTWLTGNPWGAVFLINVPIVIVGIIGIIRVVPETRNEVRRRLDIPGLLISVTGLTLLIYGIIHASETLNWIELSVIVPITAGVLIIALFIWLEARSKHASFDVRLFRNRGYSVSLTAITLAFFALSGITFSIPFYLQILRGYNTITAGLCFVPFAVGQLLSAPRSATLVARFGYRAVLTTGLLLVAAALLGITLLQIDTPLWIMLVMFFLFGLGMGAVIAPASTVMQNTLPMHQLGAGSAVQNTVRQVGGALGIAIIGTVIATQYAANLRSVFAEQTGLSPGVEQAAQQSIVATDQILQKLPADASTAALRDGAYQAFLNAAHMATGISLAVVVIAAAIVGFLLPKITPPSRISDLPPTVRDGQPTVATEGP